jgi:hypothetical protein
MQDFFSQVQTDLLLHRLIGLDEAAELPSRVDLTDPNWNLQASIMTWEESRQVKNHFHLNIERVTFNSAAQEMWLVLKGKFEVILYDIDGQTELFKKIVRPGNILLSFAGFHSITSLEDNSQFLEIKSGPYVGKDIELIKV